MNTKLLNKCIIVTSPTTMSFEHQIKILSLDTLRFQLEVEKINISIIYFDAIVDYFVIIVHFQ